MPDPHREIAKLALEQALGAFEEVMDTFFQENPDAVRQGPDALLAPKPTAEELAAERAELQGLEPNELERVLGQKIEAQGLEQTAEEL